MDKVSLRKFLNPSVLQQFLLSKLPEVVWPSANTLAPVAGSVGAGLIAAALANAFISAKLPQTSRFGTTTAKNAFPTSVSRSTLNKSPPQISDFPDILSRNIFNSEGGLGEGKNETCALKKSDLPLRLTGLIYGGRADASLIVLESTASKQVDTFVLGDSVLGEARITDIIRTRVIISRDNCPEFLDLVQPEPLKRRVAGVKKKDKGPSGPDNGTNFVEDGFERKGNMTQATRQWVERALTSDFTNTLQDAKADPNLVNGKVKGFVLTRIRPNSVYEKLGFQDGDVVEAINGLELTDIAGAIQTLNQMRQETNLELQVRRAGSSMAFKVQVK